MKDENENTIDVTRDSRDNSLLVDAEKFKTIKLFKEDIKGLYKPPQTLWDESFVGEAISDECHPENSSFIIGALGGLATGFATGFFSSNRVPLPVMTPIPSPYLPRFQVFMRNSIIGSSVVWRIAKRSILGTILFAVLECDFKDLVKKPSERWQGSIGAGAICGGIFGLRGGLPGMLLGMAIFTALPSSWEVYNRQKEIKTC